jgi:GNAT superfamily N-acetyltransferase
MKFKIRALTEADVDPVVDLSLRAWAPVFASFAEVLGPRIYRQIYPDWLSSQAREVAKVCRDHSATTWVAVAGDRPIGFVSAVLGGEGPGTAELEMLAVDPDHQRRGAAAALIDFAVEQLREAGVSVVAVGTGGDPGHAPARRAYEQAGFRPLPLVRYYKEI